MHVISKTSFSVLYVVLLLSVALDSAVAKPYWLRGTESNQGDFLPPDVAFRVGAKVEGNVFRVRWVIADGYYLYRQKMEVKAESPDLVVAGLLLPVGNVKTDPYLGTQATFRQQVEGIVPFTRSDAGAHPFQIKVTYQGCADAGLCYMPITKVLFPTVEVIPAVGHVFQPRVGIAIMGGALVFLLAGLVLRRERRLSTPAP